LPHMIAAFKSIPVKTSNIIFTLPNLDEEHPLYGHEITFNGNIISVKGNPKIEYKTEVCSSLPPANPRKKKETTKASTSD